MTQREKNLKKLNEFFVKRYSKQLDELNTKLNFSEEDEAGNIKVPRYNLTEGGITQVVGNKDAFNLNPPARLQLTDCWMKPLQTVYRVFLPYEELEIGLERDEAYLKYYMDTAIKLALDNWKLAVGDENLVRWGHCYLQWRYPGTAQQAFRDMDDMNGFELRFYGRWASEELAYHDHIAEQEHVETYMPNTDLTTRMNNIENSLIRVVEDN